MTTNEFNLTHYPWDNSIDYRQQPERYRVGKGEQGVLLCEPYKSEILPHWKFKTPELATTSSRAIFGLFLNYLEQGDFVGADIARKYLQMGFTRARRYTNYKEGRKSDPAYSEAMPHGAGDPQKAQSARIFYEKWRQAEAHPPYADLKRLWQQHYG